MAVKVSLQVSMFGFFSKSINHLGQHLSYPPVSFKFLKQIGT